MASVLVGVFCGFATEATLWAGTNLDDMKGPMDWHDLRNVLLLSVGLLAAGWFVRKPRWGALGVPIGTVLGWAAFVQPKMPDNLGELAVVSSLMWMVIATALMLLGTVLRFVACGPRQQAEEDVQSPTPAEGSQR